MTILNCGGNADAGLPDTASASAGDVLTLDNNKDAVWSTPSSGSNIVKTTLSASTLSDWLENANVGDVLTFQEITKSNSASFYYGSLTVYRKTSDQTFLSGSVRVYRSSTAYNGTKLQYTKNPKLIGVTYWSGISAETSVSFDPTTITTADTITGINFV